MSGTQQPNPAVYLDATIPSYLFDERPELAFHVQATRKWWQDERHKYRLFLSQETLVELGAGSYPRKVDVLAAVADVDMLPPSQDVDRIAERYVAEQVMPQDARGDPMHLAYASYYAMTFLLTWNCAHLANANKFQHIHVVNQRLGLHVPILTTPLQLVEED